MKRGQVTVFIIIAVVVIAAVIAYISITQLETEKNIDEEYFAGAAIKPEVDNIKNYYLGCAEDISLSALYVIGLQGGYYDEPENYYELGWAFLPYYYLEGKYLMPSRATIENELAKYVDDNLGFCLELAEYPDYELEYREPKTTVSIQENEVVFTIDMPLTITREGKSMVFDLKEHPVKQISALEDILEIAQFITDSHKDDPDMICISCLTEMAAEREVYVDLLDFAEETTTQIVISENRTSEAPYMFVFLNKYPPEQEEETLEFS
jgi:hypothetical protein